MGRNCGAQVRNYLVYVKREIQNQSSLRHPLIVSLREVRRFVPYSICVHLARAPAYQRMLAHAFPCAQTSAWACSACMQRPRGSCFSLVPAATVPCDTCRSAAYQATMP